MVELERMLKPLGFVALYALFAWAVRVSLKPFFPNGANWVFLLLIIAGFVIMYYVYYEAFYLLSEVIWPSWQGAASEADDLDSLLQPLLYALAALLLAGSFLLFSHSHGMDPDFYAPMGLGLLFLAGGIAVTYYDDELAEA
ncbi:MAG: hypothetical protein V1787_03790 [Candidatus Micrarchaeota archaeon]